MDEPKQYTDEFIRTNRAFVLNETDSTITLAVSSGTEKSVMENLSLFHEKKVIFKFFSDDDFDSAVSKKLSSKPDNSEKKENGISYASSESETVNLVNTILIDGIKMKASDIHIESGKDSARIRYRINGTLSTAFSISQEQFSLVSARIKILSNLNILEKRLPQDGRISVTVEKNSFDFRVSIIPVSEGESIVLRILGRQNEKTALEHLGFSKEQLCLLQKMLSVPHGLILVSGPTGSGKTTTLNALINAIKNDSMKIISIEDPVEYEVKGINQIQVNESIGLSFHKILRRVLRHDPDIIMVGEIRDEETALLAVRAALTGHLVLSTVHTNDAAGTIERLINMGVPPYLLASVLRGAMAQRLVKTVSKTKGRTVIAEIFLSSEKLENLIAKNAGRNEIISFLKKENFKVLKDDALLKIKKGIILKEDALKETALA